VDGFHKSPLRGLTRGKKEKGGKPPSNLCRYYHRTEGNPKTEKKKKREARQNRPYFQFPAKGQSLPNRVKGKKGRVRNNDLYLSTILKKDFRVSTWKKGGGKGKKRKRPPGSFPCFFMLLTRRTVVMGKEGEKVPDVFLAGWTRR